MKLTSVISIFIDANRRASIELPDLGKAAEDAESVGEKENDCIWTFALTLPAQCAGESVISGPQSLRPVDGCPF